MKKLRKTIFIFILTVMLTTQLSHADQVYKVTPKDTISGIARKFNITIDSLMANNQYIENQNMLKAGQILIIPPQNRQAYKIRRGDTLYSISQKLGLPIMSIASRNGIRDTNRITEGRYLILPEYYTVNIGDTLYKISKEFKISLLELTNANNLKDINFIYEGQRLIIPRDNARREDLVDVERVLEPVVNRFQNTFFYKGPSTEKKVALTFDDGPHSKQTNDILNILKEHNVSATFFLLGNNIQGKNDIIQRIVNEGHVLGNHTWNHPNITRISEDELENEIQRLEQSIFKITGFRTVLMRPPFGFVSDKNMLKLEELDYKVIKWSADSFDWDAKSPDEILINVLPNLRRGGIVLLHDNIFGQEGKSNELSVTARALPDIIMSLRLQGYEFVTVDELLGIDAYR